MKKDVKSAPSPKARNKTTVTAKSGTTLLRRSADAAAVAASVLDVLQSAAADRQAQAAEASRTNAQRGLLKGALSSSSSVLPLLLLSSLLKK